VRDLLLLLCGGGRNELSACRVETPQRPVPEASARVDHGSDGVRGLRSSWQRKARKSVFERLASSLIRFASCRRSRANFYYDLPGPAEPSDAVRVSSMRTGTEDDHDEHNAEEDGGTNGDDCWSDEYAADKA